MSSHILLDSDASGRGVLVSNVASYDFRDSKAFLRAAWYSIVTTIEENEDIQRRGVVQVASLYGEFRHTSAQVAEFLLKTKHIHQAWPFHDNCIHLCSDNAFFHAFQRATYAALRKEVRVRLKVHFGSKQEAQYEMMTYGIQLPGCFCDGKGETLSKEIRDEYLRERRRIDDRWNEKEQSFESAKSKFALYPNPQDILMGRGRGLEWPGNRLFLRRVALFAPRYMEADSKNRFQKTVIAMTLVRNLETEGARFLERTDEGWRIADDDVIKDKVTQTLRDRVHRQRKKAERI